MNDKGSEYLGAFKGFLATATIGVLFWIMYLSFTQDRPELKYIPIVEAGECVSG